MPITIKMVLRPVADDSLLKGMHRVLFVDQKKDKVILIPVTSDNKGWFVERSFRALSQELEPSEATTLPKLSEVKLKLPAIQLLTDEEITRRYPSRLPDPAGVSTSDDAIAKHKKLSATIQARKDRLELIRPLIYVDGDMLRPREELFSDGYISRWITNRAKELGRKVKSHCYTCLRLYFVWGETENALLGDYHACGAKGVDRAPRKDNTKCGRRNTLFRAGETDHPGFSVAGNDMEKERIQAFCAGKSAKDGSVESWYDEYTAAFHHQSIRLVDGCEEIELKPPHERPTLDQFRYWANKAEEPHAAWHKRLTAQEYDQIQNPKFGTARDGLLRVGQLATLDLTSGDVHLTSVESKIKPAGIASRIPVLDVFLDLSLGVHCFYGRHSPLNALLALYIAFSSKGWLGERLGLPFVNDENFLLFVPESILVDHDEFFSNEAKLAAKNAGLNLVFPAPRRGDYKPTVEADHRNNHADTGHRMTGTTHGRKRKPGEPDPAIEACWDIQEFTRAEWRHRYHRNCMEPVPPEMITMEMRADKVHQEPTRINVARWLIRNGYAKCSTADPAKFVTYLLPRIRARATPEGVFLLRPDRGNADIFIELLKYEYPMWLFTRWFGGPSKRHFDIEVRHNPYDLSSVYWVDPDHGMQQFRLRTNDPLLTNHCLEDLLRIQDESKLIELRQRQATETARANYNVELKADDLTAQAQKKAELEAATEKPTKKALKQGIRQTQDAEKEKLRQFLAPPAMSPPAICRNAEKMNQAAETADRPIPDNPIRTLLRKALQSTKEPETGGSA